MRRKISEHDKTVLRKLAQRQAEISGLAINKEKIEMWRKLNSLEKVRPMVWINPHQIPWNEIGIESQLETSHPFSKELELSIKKRLYMWDNLRTDMVMDDKLYSLLVIELGNFGLTENSDTIFAPGSESIASHHYERQIQTEHDVEKIKTPEVKLNKELTEYNYHLMLDIFKDIIPVEKRGQPGFWFAPWDILTTWWGGQELLMDMALRPELLKLAISRLTDAYLQMLKRYEDMNLLSLNSINYNFGNGTGGLGYTNELPQNNFDPNHIHPKDMWGSAAAQIFSEVSPKMHKEFATDYEIKWLKLFGLNYYGCCEPLHKKIDIIKEIPNLRKISISPWADIEEAAKAIEDKYVFSYKSNPAIFAYPDWDSSKVYSELNLALSTISGYGCNIEVILKDVSTITQQPQKLMDWAHVAMEIVENFV